jgi:hypothetical protein
MSFFKNETEEKEKCSCEDNYAEKILIWYFLVLFWQKVRFDYGKGWGGEYSKVISNCFCFLK